MTPDRLGPYRILEVVGQGGMGQVFRARHEALGVERAVKVLTRLDPEAALRLRREAASLAAIKHPNVVRVHELGGDHGKLWFSMDLVEGRPLHQVLAKGCLPLDQALQIARGVCAGLAVLHAAGILHRDLKPANILIRPDGSPVILDLGLALRALGEQRMTQTGQTVGTLAYMAPEQLRGGELSPATDVFAMGLILYEMLTGHAARAGGGRRQLTLMHEVLNARIPPPSGGSAEHVPFAYDTICQRATDPRPSRRYPDAAALLHALEHPDEQPPPISHSKGASWQAGAAVGVVFALLVGAVASVVTHGSGPKETPPPVISATPVASRPSPPLSLGRLRALLGEREHGTLLREAHRWLEQNGDRSQRSEVEDLLWRARQALVSTLDVGGTLTRVGFVGETRLVTACRVGRTVKLSLYELSQAGPVRVRRWRLSLRSERLKLSACSRWIVVCSGGRWVLLDPDQDAPAGEYMANSYVFATALSPSGRWLVLGAKVEQQGYLAVLSLERGSGRGREVARLTTQANPLAVAFTDDDHVLGSVQYEEVRNIRMGFLNHWGWKSGTRETWPELEPTTCLTLAGRLVARGTARADVFLIDRAHGRSVPLHGENASPFGELQAAKSTHRGAVHRVAYAPAVDLLFSASQESGGVGGSEVRVWKPRTGREVHNMLDLPHPPTDLVTSPRGTRMALALGGKVQVWPLVPDPPTTDGEGR